MLPLSKGFDPAVIERWLRVYGDTLRRITEAESDRWFTKIQLPDLASGLNEAKIWGQAWPDGSDITSGA